MGPKDSANPGLILVVVRKNGPRIAIDKVDACLVLINVTKAQSEVMTMSVVGGQPKKKNTQIPVIKPQNRSNALFKSLIITSC